MNKLTLPQVHQKIFSGITACANKLGVEAYVVGGYVRDMLLGLPSKDIDVVCVGSGIRLARAVADYFGSTVAEYANFGTAATVVHGVELEFVGARKESYDRGSRKPIVEDGTLRDDLTRRDFTFNALAVALSGPMQGELIDMFNGVRDLDSGMICTPTDPDITFSDDPLRMLRAVRFATRFKFDVYAPVFESIVRNVNRMEIVSAERRRTELNKIMSSPNAVEGIRSLDQCGLLNFLIPELVALKGTETIDGQSYKETYEHSLVVLQHAVDLTDNVWIRWAALLHDIGKARTRLFTKGFGWSFHNHEELGAKMVAKIFNRLKVPGDDSDFVQKLVKLHGRPMQMAGNVTDSAVRRIMFDAGDVIGPLMTLVRCDYSTVNPKRIERHLNYCDVVDAKMMELEAVDSMRAFRPAVDGIRIMEMFNLKPGREVGAYKNAMADAILDGKVANNVEDLERWLQALPMGVV